MSEWISIIGAILLLTCSLLIFAKSKDENKEKGKSILNENLFYLTLGATSLIYSVILTINNIVFICLLWALVFLLLFLIFNYIIYNNKKDNEQKTFRIILKAWFIVINFLGMFHFALFIFLNFIF